MILDKQGEEPQELQTLPLLVVSIYLQNVSQMNLYGNPVKIATDFQPDKGKCKCYFFSSLIHSLCCSHSFFFFFSSLNIGSYLNNLSIASIQLYCISLHYCLPLFQKEFCTSASGNLSNLPFHITAFEKAFFSPFPKTFSAVPLTYFNQGFSLTKGQTPLSPN